MGGDPAKAHDEQVVRACARCHQVLFSGYPWTIASHRPMIPPKVEGDRPLGCALCHGDRSVGSLVDTLEAWWGHRYDRARLRRLYGDLDANALEATLRLGKPHERAVAAYLAGILGRKD